MSQKTDHDMIVEMHSILCGNGHTGLCQEFEDHKKDDQKFRRLFYTFRLWVIIVTILILGLIGLDAGQIIKLLAGG